MKLFSILVIVMSFSSVALAANASNCEEAVLKAGEYQAAKFFPDNKLTVSAIREVNPENYEVSLSRIGDETHTSVVSLNVEINASCEVVGIRPID